MAYAAQSQTAQPVAKQAPDESGILRWPVILTWGVDFTAGIQSCLNDFWGVHIQGVFMGASLQPSYMWVNEQFYVTQLELKTGTDVPEHPLPPVLLRFSDFACECLLTEALGETGHPFSLTQLTAFERTIMTSCTKKILKTLKTQLHPVKTLDMEHSLLQHVVHFVWLLHVGSTPSEKAGSRKGIVNYKDTDQVYGKLVLSLPQVALNLSSAQTAMAQAYRQAQETPVDESLFYSVTTDRSMVAGSTRVTLGEMNLLEPDDMIILEQSRYDELWLLSPDKTGKTAFTIAWSPQQQNGLMIQDEKDYIDMESPASGEYEEHDIWDNIQVDLTAELDPVKLPLKQLREISEGLVVELSSLVNNQVTLIVEGKPLARGNLLIVGDKFGVRVSEVLAKRASAMPPEADEASPQHNTMSEEALEEDVLSLSDLDEDSSVDTALDEEEDDFDAAFEDEDEKDEEWD
jgi:flagellar motor switch protein FliN